MWEMNAPRCSCPGCASCSEWLSEGPGCWQPRARSERHKDLATMRCSECAAVRDAAIQSTQGKGAGKGQSSTGSGAAAGTARREDDAQSSTGSDSAAGTARREDDARIVQLNIDMRTCRDEVRRNRLEITALSDEVMRLQAMMEDWARWYNNK